MASPSKNDRYLAAAIHGLGIPFPWGAAIIGFFVAGAMGNRYAKYHAAKAFLGEVGAFLLTATIVIISLAMSIPKMGPILQGQWDQVDWWGIVIKSVVVWLGLAAFGLWNTITSIRMAMRCLHDEDWGKNKGTDRWARRLAGVSGEVPVSGLTPTQSRETV
ncbi:MAG: hypothetical protein KF812_01565 [Fimbriimonadaceae bacterium]|nr:hypothetical protein [Fimbriimonadaceae bacterium]